MKDAEHTCICALDDPRTTPGARALLGWLDRVLAEPVLTPLLKTKATSFTLERLSGDYIFRLRFADFPTLSRVKPFANQIAKALTEGYREQAGITLAKVHIHVQL